jgi:DNA-directed RNA polymerase
LPKPKEIRHGKTGDNTITLTQEQLNEIMIAQNLRGYVRAVRELSKQIHYIADSLEVSCQEIERQYKTDMQEQQKKEGEGNA